MDGRCGAIHVRNMLCATVVVLLLLQPAASEEAKANSWSEILLSGDVPPRTSDRGFTTARGKLYALGGTDVDVDLTEIDQHGVCTRLDEGANVTGESPRGGPRGLTRMGFTSTEDALFVFGGSRRVCSAGGCCTCTGGSLSTCCQVGDFYQFSLDNRTWTQLNSTTGVMGTPPAPRQELCLVVLGGSVMVLGGDYNYGDDNGWGFRYDIISKNWSALPPPPESRIGHGHASCAVMGNKVYVHLGNHDHIDFQVLHFDGHAPWTVEPQWTVIESVAVFGSKPVNEQSFRLASFGGNLVQFGGTTLDDGEWTYDNNVQIFRPAINTWIPTNPTGHVPLPRIDFGNMPVIDDAMYVQRGWTPSRYGPWSMGYLLAYHFPSECSRDSSQNVRLVACQSSDNCCRVEVFNAGEWGTVCDDSWGNEEANVVCAEMGCSVGTRVQHFGGGSGRIWMDNVVCTGSEESLTECRSNGWGLHNCVHDEDAGVCCSGVDVQTGSCVVTRPTATHCLPDCHNNSTPGDCECGPGLTGPTGGLCTTCDMGKYKRVSGSAECLSCPPGKYSNQNGSVSIDWCLDCVAGKYQETEAASDCDDCASGKFSEVVASTLCVHCVAGKYAIGMGNKKSSDCEDCETGKYSDVVGATTIDTCLYCGSGKYLDAGIRVGPCFPCPIGFSCPAGGGDKVIAQLR